ncbi:uncharacterized protein DNG_02357 [Cephalotrichum gorgonifer]|uniref:Kinetochore protein fta4 n=1 Tax=Cephalotrichum gorgonifer TaxID=2041049 RepID=A0AAE8MUB9_9PEZI|nr:uncharacterized protein DNG_02357 [Cephalotrichum gorgonifer]
MSHPPPTIVSKKLSFLTAQTRILTTPDPLPTRAWTRANASSESPVPQRAVDDALSKLAQVTRQHARRVYAPQAARHVAEQVEGLYWEDAERTTEGVGGDGIGREVDLTDDAVISRLPPTWPSDRDTAAHPDESHRYTTQSARLAALSDERRARRARVQRLRRMRSLLRPFETSLEDVAGVQESLLTRGGPLEEQLERMRMLLARVAGRVALSEAVVPEDRPAGEVLGGEEARVERVLKNL